MAEQRPQRPPRPTGNKPFVRKHGKDARKQDVKLIFSHAFAARVEEVIGRTGVRGEAIQIRCRVLEGRDTNKVMTRNVKGPVRKDDILMLRETEIEARKIGRGGGR